MLSKQDLIDDLASGCRPFQDFRIGTEHERFVFDTFHNRLPYQGVKSIQAVLEAMQPLGWRPVYENDVLISLSCPSTGATISLEPGGQFELSGAPLKTLHETYAELTNHESQLNHISQTLGVTFETKGFDPYNRRDQIPWMPKDRYKIMKRYMPLKGSLGLDMMTRTCTVQVNLDYSSEQDMVLKMRVGMALQPFVTALFAHSTQVEGQPTLYQSYRAQIWQDTDPDRCGLLPFVFEDSMGFERYVDYMLGVPLYFVKRNGRYIDVAGQSFNDFMQGHLPDLWGECATLSDWHDHLTVAFPEVRLKHYLEMRGADSGPLESLIALPSFWVGLLYDGDSLQNITNLISDWTFQEIKALYEQVPRQGIKASFKGIGLKKWLTQILEISHQGLMNRNCLNNQRQTEAIYLDLLTQ